MKLYNHISKKERQRIEFLLNNNYSIRSIAKELNRYPSSISREINRNKINIDNKSNNINNNYNEYNNKYSWFEAQYRSKDIRFKNINKIDKYPDLQNYIIDKLNKRWSPEQISGRLKLERSDKYVSYGTIYSYIYKNNNKNLIKLLPNYNKRIYINNKCFIKKNSDLPSIHDRINSDSIDSWEVDLIHFGRKTKQNNII